jgi:hypothetical protein
LTFLICFRIFNMTNFSHSWKHYLINCDFDTFVFQVQQFLKGMFIMPTIVWMVHTFGMHRFAMELNLQMYACVFLLLNCFSLFVFTHLFQFVYWLGKMEWDDVHQYYFTQ